MSLALKSANSFEVVGIMRICVVKVNVGIQPNAPYLLETTGGKMSE